MDPCVEADILAEYLAVRQHLAGHGVLLHSSLLQPGLHNSQTEHARANPTLEHILDVRSLYRAVLNHFSVRGDCFVLLLIGHNENLRRRGDQHSQVNLVRFEDQVDRILRVDPPIRFTPPLPHHLVDELSSMVLIRPQLGQAVVATPEEPSSGLLGVKHLKTPPLNSEKAQGWRS